MADTQDITQAVIQAAVKAMAMAGAEASAILRTNAVNAGPKLGKPSLKQLTFHWRLTDKYTVLRNFKLEVNNIFQT